MLDVYPQVPLTFWWFLDPAMKSRPPPKICPPWVHACSGYACQRSGCWKWREGRCLFFFWSGEIGGLVPWILTRKAGKLPFWLEDTSSNVFFTLYSLLVFGGETAIDFENVPPLTTWDGQQKSNHVGCGRDITRWAPSRSGWHGAPFMGFTGVISACFLGVMSSPHSKTIVFGPTLGSCHIPKVGTLHLWDKLW